jgi:hypothetical protein
VANGTPVVLPTVLEPSFTTDKQLEYLIGRTVAKAASVAAKGVEERRAGGIRPATLQEAGDLTAELYWLRREVLASGKLAGDFQAIARSEGLKILRKYCGNETSDNVLEILVDGELEILDRVVTATHRMGGFAVDC